VLLGRLFDTVGRKPMIAGSYLGSAAVLCLLTILFLGGSLGVWGFMARLLATFFLASAGASSAYLTVSEIFPMETRALAIAFFYAIGTAVGGITGPYLFGKMIESGSDSQVAIAFFIGAGVMALGGIFELLFGVKAEQQELEGIAPPLSAEDAEGAAEERPAPPPRPSRAYSSPGMWVAAPVAAVGFEREVRAIERAPSPSTTARSTAASSPRSWARGSGGRGAMAQRCGPRWCRGRRSGWGDRGLWRDELLLGRGAATPTSIS
jgi:MFS family permease